LLEAAQRNPASLILVLRECGALGHLPMKGTFSMVAFNDKNAPGGKAIVGMEEWRGVVDRIFRAGGVESVHVEVGREKDPVLSFNRTTDVLPRHKYDEFASPAQRGPLKVVYAWARFRAGGVSQVAWLPRYEIDRHRSMSRSASKAGGGNFWGPADGEGPNTEPMWKKTALHVLAGFVPTSSEYRAHVAVAESAARGWSGVDDRPVSSLYGGAGDFLDGEVVDVDGTAPATGWPAVPAAGSGQLPPKEKADA
jgi:recombination protein RecT